MDAAETKKLIAANATSKIGKTVVDELVTSAAPTTRFYFNSREKSCFIQSLGISIVNEQKFEVVEEKGDSIILKVQGHLMTFTFIGKFLQCKKEGTPAIVLKKES